ncbi:hypothetical protein OIU77_026858 [Salix suchowensis]|uniref:Uncharacterized protein n=1 Tax=Salix suchowensis TaxID=1278906 RepID=A0ABQ9BMR5_9ROSI|nr:hypothetical protein OIU77_026858 [Salix suchowensis]
MLEIVEQFSIFIIIDESIPWYTSFSTLTAMICQRLITTGCECLFNIHSSKYCCS